MKRIILAILLAAGTSFAAETNLTVKVDVPDNIVDIAKMYMDMTGQTNVTVRQWLSSNVVVTLPANVTESVATRKQDMINQIQNGSWDFIRSILNKFGY